MQSQSEPKNASFIFCDFFNEYHCNKLADLISHYMEDPMGDCRPLSEVGRLNLIFGLANHPSSFVLFVTVGDEIVGLATGFINFSTFKAKRYLNIHDVIVLKDFRGKGYGRKLLEKCIEIAKERDYCKVTLEVREDNTSAQLLYESLDFKESIPPMYFWTKTLS